MTEDNTSTTRVKPIRVSGFLRKSLFSENEHARDNSDDDK